MSISLYAGTVELPYIVVSISVATCSRQHGPVSCLSHVVIIKSIASRSSFEVKTHGHTFIARLTVHGWLGWDEGIVVFDEQSVVMVTRAMGRLKHVEVEPGSIVQF